MFGVSYLFQLDLLLLIPFARSNYNIGIIEIDFLEDGGVLIYIYYEFETGSPVRFSRPF
jgi:hypothetical protein